VLAGQAEADERLARLEGRLNRIGRHGRW
jgi:hypothetical protein